MSFFPNKYRNYNVVIILGLLVFFTIYLFPKEDTVTFLDVGQGDASFIDIDGFQILIDGGDGESILSELRSVMPLFDRTIDMVIATHPDADHIGGLPEVLKRYKVKYIIDNGTYRHNELFQEWELQKYNSYTKEAKYSHGTDIKRIQISDTVDVRFFNTEEKFESTNNKSIVIQLNIENISFLFAGDIEKEAEIALVEKYKEDLKSTVLKVPHHGSKTSSTKLFLQYVGPDISIISAGCDNRYGHPHVDVLARLRLVSEVYSTCEKGRIQFKM